MKKNFLKSANSSVIIVLAFLIALNFLVSQGSFYLDLTSDKLYTPSEVSKNILKNLETNVDVTFYISEELPSDYLNFKIQIEDVINQYQDLSGGKMNISYETPDNEDVTVTELAQMGIPQLQSEVVEKDKIEVKRFFFGVIVSSSENDGKTEVLPVVPSLESFEYNLISAIYSVSKNEKEIIAMLSGHGEREIDYSELEKSYDIVDGVLINAESEQEGFYVKNTSSEEEQIEKEFFVPNTVIIVSPEENISEEEISYLKKYVEGGGNIIVLSEKINPDLEQGFVTKNIENNINDLIGYYGIKINNDLVYDNSNSAITYSKQTFWGTQYVQSAYPFWININQENFSDHSSLSKIQSLVLLWVSSLDVSDTEEYQTEILFTSSSKSNSMTENFDISPEQNLIYSSAKKNLGAVSTSEKSGGSVVVIGDSDFISPSFMQSISDNEIFFLNLVDGVSSSVNLSSIRSKNVSSRPIKEISDSEKSSWKYFAILGGSVLISVYGFIRINRRKKKSKIL